VALNRRILFINEKTGQVKSMSSYRATTLAAMLCSYFND